MSLVFEMFKDLRALLIAEQKARLEASRNHDECMAFIKDLREQQELHKQMYSQIQSDLKDVLERISQIQANPRPEITRAVVQGPHLQNWGFANYNGGQWNGVSRDPRCFSQPLQSGRFQPSMRVAADVRDAPTATEVTRPNVSTAHFPTAMVPHASFCNDTVIGPNLPYRNVQSQPTYRPSRQQPATIRPFQVAAPQQTRASPALPAKNMLKRPLPLPSGNDGRLKPAPAMQAQNGVPQAARVRLGPATPRAAADAVQQPVLPQPASIVSCQTPDMEGDTTPMPTFSSVSSSSSLCFSSFQHHLVANTPNVEDTAVVGLLYPTDDSSGVRSGLSDGIAAEVGPLVLAPPVGAGCRDGMTVPRPWSSPVPEPEGNGHVLSDDDDESEQDDLPPKRRRYKWHRYQ